jgi:hypothetical protein
MIQFHRSIPAALKHAGTWAGFSGVFTSLGSQLDKPYAMHMYGLSALCGMLAIIIKSPNDGDTPPSP